MLRDSVRRVGGHAHNAQSALCSGQIDIVVARAADEQQPDTHIAQPVYNRAVDGIVYKAAHGVLPARELDRVDAQLCVVPAQLVSAAIHRLKGFYIIFFRVKKRNCFHFSLPAAWHTYLVLHIFSFLLI